VSGHWRQSRILSAISAKASPRLRDFNCAPNSLHKVLEGIELVPHNGAREEVEIQVGTVIAACVGPS
jgi:hypothetical protein